MTSCIRAGTAFFVSMVTRTCVGHVAEGYTIRIYGAVILAYVLQIETWFCLLLMDPTLMGF